MVRGTVPLPHGSGKTVRVLVFARGGAAAEAAKAAGAENVGFEDMIAKCVSGWTDFDVAIATPDAMIEVRKLGKVLGPRGLMPNPKTGTVTPDVETAVRNAKAGQVRFRADKNGIVHGAIGKVTFDLNSIKENLEALLGDLKRAKPPTSKGIYLKKITLSSTMGPGIVIDQTSLEG
jgi:large subunit ribosomal protein L1